MRPQTVRPCLTSNQENPAAFVSDLGTHFRCIYQDLSEVRWSLGSRDDCSEDSLRLGAYEMSDESRSFLRCWADTTEDCKGRR